MPYKFTFDLSRISRFFFTEITRAGYKTSIHKKMGRTAQEIIKKFRIDEATGLNLSDAVLIIQDLLEIQARNLLERQKFLQTKKRALFLPHCSRKYMDSRCKALFNPDIPSYTCAHCSPDCLINKAVSIAEKKKYDVYILPGGSCVPQILKANNYEGVVGIACGEEIKMAGELTRDMNVAGQAIPLIKNGCANTFFNIETLYNIL